MTASTWAKEAPPWPAFCCNDGWAWHPKEQKRHCRQGLIHAPAATVASVYDGSPITRMLAVRTLLLSGPQNALLKILFPDCETCGTNPVRLTQLRCIWRRSAMAIHEGAIENIRAAEPAFMELWTVNTPSPCTSMSPRYVSYFARGIPVRDPSWNRRRPPEGEPTRIAQIFWASSIIAAREERAAS